MRNLALGIPFLALASAAFAAEQERVLESPRALGRGNTFVAAYDSDEATRENPATLAETKITYQLRWLQLDLMVGENTLSSINDVNKLNGEASAVSLLNTFADKFGQRQYARFQGAPLAMRFGSFEMMPYVTTTNFVDLRRTPAEVDFRSDTQYGVALSYAKEINKEWTLGLTLRPADRTVFAGQVQFSDLLNFLNNSNFQLQDVFSKKEGTQVGADIGAIYRPNAMWRFGLLVENAGYAGNYGGSDSAPDPFQQRVDLGMNYRVDMKPWHWDILIDGQDLVNPNHYNYFRLLHMGTELGRSYISRDNDIGITGGVNEGYFTAGTYIDMFIARLNVTYYAVELGEYPGQRKDRRWGMTLASTMTF